MAKSIQIILSPLLIASYVCGIRIVESSARHPKLWLYLLYVLLLWSAYCFFMIKVIPYVIDDLIEYAISVSLDMFMTLFIILLGLYHDKKFRECMKKLTVVDDTMEMLGTKTDYEKRRTRLAWIISRWFVFSLLLDFSESIWWKQHYDIGTALWIPLIMNYCNDIIFIDDLIFTNILEYIGLKFDQVNEHLRQLDNQFKHNKREIKRAWENPILRNSHRHESLNAPSTEHIIWIVIHLHLELRKISCDVNSIFRIQITLKMACYFFAMAQIVHELFDTLFKEDISNIYIARYITISISIFWLFWYLCRLLLVNCVCEKVSAKANATGDIVNRISYSTCNMEMRENIMQFLLQTMQAPLRFYGFGFFFGFKFLYEYFEIILAYLVILVQTNKSNYSFFKNF